ncbi:precorrin-8X methylmutase [Thermogymnomonas acidicola]|uniref:precorrin-8X methylmutase n=1 Tax=Thermogymnomonas acidicola TaxID=399579 RepID=UPI00094680FC|nr:precorrin-8X methylmutase [Thermogymnomonas acidicola]
MRVTSDGNLETLIRELMRRASLRGPECAGYDFEVPENGGEPDQAYLAEEISMLVKAELLAHRRKESEGDIIEASLRIISCISGVRPDSPENLLRLRAAHAVADPFVARIMRMSGDFVERAVSAVRSGCDIVFDSAMAMAGVYSSGGPEEVQDALLRP